MLEVPREIFRAQFSTQEGASLSVSLVMHMFTGIETIFSRGRKGARVYCGKGLQSSSAENKKLYLR